jgi:hypothetical protein
MSSANGDPERAKTCLCCVKDANGQHASECHILLWLSCLGKKFDDVSKPPERSRFLELPAELRLRIYEAALYTGQAIQPHLCDRKDNGAIKFHDDSQHSGTKPNHAAINNLLGITRVSKRTRAESVPCFYSINTFSVVSDTATYFARLDQIGRFHMIRHVSFSIPMLTAEWTTQVLEQMTTYLRNVEAYERENVLPWAHMLTPTMRRAGLISHPMAYKVLVEHPRHIVGGLDEMALLICMRMLTSTMTAPSNDCTLQLVLPVPSVDKFNDLTKLQWFKSVSHCLGIHLRFLEDHELDYVRQGATGITWHQRYQKTDFKQVGNADEASVKKRRLAMFPELQGGKFWTKCSYMRTSCDRETYTWVEVQH